MNSQLLTPEELAERLRVRPTTVKAWRRDGLIPGIRINAKVVRFDFEAVLRALRGSDSQSEERGARAR